MLYPIPSSMYHLRMILCFENSSVRTDAMDNMMEKRERIIMMIKSIRSHSIYDLEKCVREYMDVWMVLVTVLENQRTLIQSPLVFSTGWSVPSNAVTEMYVSDVWRFETIMIGILYSSILFNIGVMENIEKKSHERFLDAYSVLSGVCLSNIIAWTLRDEMKLPFECTERGCNILMAMNLVEIQRFYTCSNQNSEMLFSMNYWNYKKLEEISCYLSCRQRDRTIKGHFWMNHARDYKNEASIGMYHSYINFLSRDKTMSIEDQKKTQFLCECTLKIIDEILSRHTKMIYQITKKKNCVSDSIHKRFGEIKEEISNIELGCRNYLNSLMVNMVREEKNSERDPRTYIPREWLKVFFYGITIKQDCEKYCGYHGLDSKHSRELQGVIFYF